MSGTRAQEVGFEVTAVSTSLRNDGFDRSGVDVRYVSSGLVYPDLSEPARAALDGFPGPGGVVRAPVTTSRSESVTGRTPRW